jgi:hypothetical protein
LKPVYIDSHYKTMNLCCKTTILSDSLQISRRKFTVE